MFLKFNLLFKFLSKIEQNPQSLYSSLHKQLKSIICSACSPICVHEIFSQIPSFCSTSLNSHLHTSVFIVNYLKAHASVGVPINSIEYVMRILSGADCRDEVETNEIFDKFLTRKAPNDDIDA